MNIITNTDNSNIDVTCILLVKLMREQHSRASKKVVPMANFVQDYQTKTIPLQPAPIYSIRNACSPSTSKSTTGGIGNWLKEAKLYDQHASLLRGGLRRKASRTKQLSRERKGFPLAATKNRSMLRLHSMRTFRALWSNGASRDQHVNREVFARKLQRGTLIAKTGR
jgi:hypothetical protein